MRAAVVDRRIRPVDGYGYGLVGPSVVFSGSGDAAWTVQSDALAGEFYRCTNTSGGQVGGPRAKVPSQSGDQWYVSFLARLSPDSTGRVSIWVPERGGSNGGTYIGSASGNIEITHPRDGLWHRYTTVTTVDNNETTEIWPYLRSFLQTSGTLDLAQFEVRSWTD